MALASKPESGLVLQDAPGSKNLVARRVQRSHSIEIDPSLAIYLLALALVCYIAIYTFISAYKFVTFRQGFDLAQNEQTIWNTSQGRWFQSSPFVNLKYDFDDGPVPLELGLAALYRLFPTTFTLLFLQSLALAAGAIPLFALARAKLNAWSALGIALAYLFHVTITRMNMYEFQLRSFVLPFFLAAFYFFERRRFQPFVFFALLMLACKSEVALTLPVFGLYAWLTRRSVRWVVTPVVLGVGWFLFVFGYVIPTFVPRDFIGSVYGYGWLGSNLGEIALTLVTRPLYVLEHILTPGKVTYVVQSFWLLLLLPLLYPRLLLFALPNLALSLLATAPVQYSVLFFYQPFVVGAFFLAAIYGIAETLPRFAGSYTRALQFGIPLLLLAASVSFNLTWNNLALRAVRGGEPPDRLAAASRVLSLIPADAAVAASQFLGPHLAQREHLYFFPGNNSYPFPSDAVDYVVVDLRQDTGAQARGQLERLQANEHWRILSKDTDYLLLKRTP